MSVIVDISVSLDGFITRPGDNPEHPLGIGGERLHEWLFAMPSWRRQHGLDPGDPGAAGVEDAWLADGFARTGAVVMGRRMFDNGAPHWGDEPPFHVPVFVLTGDPRPPVVARGGTTFTFVPDGPAPALALARAAAGGRDVAVAGGARAIRAYLRAGVVDELTVHLVHELFGAGIRLFGEPDRPDAPAAPAGGTMDSNLDSDLDLNLELALDRTASAESPGVTHLRFRPRR